MAQADFLFPESSSSRLDLEVLLCHLLDKNRTYLYTWPEKQLSNAEVDALNLMIQKRQQGTPIAHIIETREFWSLPFKVTPDTLIPRPDTEVLIEWVLGNFSDTPKSVIDLGTGTGAIALSLASEFSTWDVCGCDRIPAAVALALENAKRLGLSRVRFFESNWFDACAHKTFDLIVTNPPYIPEDDPHLKQGDVVFEPSSALTSGLDGLDDIRFIAAQSWAFLNSEGCIVIEHGFDQAESVKRILTDVGFADVDHGQDYGGNDRFSFGWKRDAEK
jgi:release factor glutamine methyltransferase